MQFGLSLPQFGPFGDVRKLMELAQTAEAAGWDGFFIWDHVIFDDLWRPMVDPWVALAAIATATERVRIGPLITPVARRRPWKLARESVSLDRLSGGRLILGVGLGSPEKWEFGAFGEETDNRIRAEKLDEGLEILLGLWSGETFRFQGKHYQLEEVRFLPTPFQQPRIPIWVAGLWPNKPPMRRAARFDGAIPIKVQGTLTPDEWRDALAYIHQQRAGDKPFDAVAMGVTPGDDPQRAGETIAAYADAGCNWWIEDISPYGYGLPWSAREWPTGMEVRLEERIRQGPPKQI
ncbi:MAG: LLM class flavin-dependent oxidoreductase [Caldilineaceae bacterium]|nr:LLM class flavin-dependent oxidoreductase [Caldilineaceae bacterium]HRJ41546.1 LLM class flavin-dependent oxidoreductase [Caldilineaceae bacterium]